MTYGLYTKDLKAYSLKGVSLETAREYLKEGYVICSLKRKCVGVYICIYWHRRWELHRSKGYIVIGPLELCWSKEYMMVADKVVEEYKPKEDEVADGR